MYRGGLSYMRYSISDTAEHGDYTGGDRLVTDATRKEMGKMLEEIRSGAYAKRWIAENEAGRPWFDRRRKEERSQPIEEVGAKLRAMIPFLDSVVVTPEGDVKSAAAAKETEKAAAR
jgi:ketol-acid reductoisomerase